MPAPVASGWSGRRVGLAPLESATFSRPHPIQTFPARRLHPIAMIFAETYSFELEDQLAKETRGDCSNSPATASSSTGSTAVLTSVATISVASGDRSTTLIGPID